MTFIKGRFKPFLELLLVAVVSLNFFYLLIRYQIWNIANDPGLGWHIKTGQYVATNFWPPTYDIFLFNMQDTLWVSNQWLSDLIFYLTLDFVGWRLLYLIAAFIITIALFELLLIRLLTSTQSILLLAPCFLFIYYAHFVHFILRPVLFQIIFFVIWIFWCFRINQKFHDDPINQPIINKKLSILMIATAILWCNMHPSFVIALICLSILLAFILIENYIGIINSSKKELTNLVLLVTAVWLATGINPYFFDLHGSIFYYMTGEQIRIQEEWKKLDLISETGNFFLIQLFVTAVLFILSFGRAIKIGIFPAFITFMFALAALSGVRYITFFSTCALFFIYYYYPFLKPDLKKWLNNSSKESNIRAINLTRWIIYSGLIVLTVTIFSYPDKNYGPSKKVYPYRAIKFLDQKVKEETGIINDLNWGGIVVFLSDKIKPTIDDRLFLYPAEFVTNYLKLVRTPSKKALRQIKHPDHQYILVKPKDKLGRWLKNNFPDHKIYQDKIAVIYRVPEL